MVTTDENKAANSSDSTPQALLRDPGVRLMLRIRDDVPGAFEELVEQYQHRVIGILYHMVGDHDEAEDLGQEVFLRIFRGRQRYKPTAKLSTWLFTIVNNLALNAIRDRKRRPVREITPQESGPNGPRPLEQLVASPSSSMPSRIFAKAELADVVRAAVQQLSEEQRMAVMLNKFEDMSYQQIADIMQKTPMAVKSLLARARYTLRELLEPYLQQGDKLQTDKPQSDTPIP